MTIWLDPEGFLLSEISQTEKDKYYMIALIRIWNLRKTELIETEG